MSGHENAAKRAIKRRSVTEVFHRDLRDLFVQTKSTKLFFIRCIKMKSDDSKRLDHAKIAKQIRYGGLVSFASSVEALLEKCERAEESERARAAIILTQWAGQRVASLVLDRAINKSATIIVAWFRSYQERRRYMARKAAACVIMKYARRMFINRVPVPSVDEENEEPDKGARAHYVVTLKDTDVQDILVSEQDERVLLNENESITAKSQVNELIDTQNGNEEGRHLRLLVAQLKQNVLHAEMHNQDIEIEYEERLSEYEREVLVLRQQLAAYESEKAALKGEIEASTGNVESLKEGIRSLQESHKGYLEKVMRAVEKANVEHRNAIEAMKRTRDARIAQLRAEIDSLRKRHEVFDLSPREKHKKVYRLARKLEKHLSPISIASQLSKVQGKVLDEDDIERCISSKARNLIYRMEDLLSVPQAANDSSLRP